MSIEVTVSNVYDLAGNQAEQFLWSFVGSTAASNSDLIGLLFIYV
jgi:hypothetical protein